MVAITQERPIMFFPGRSGIRTKWNLLAHALRHIEEQVRVIALSGMPVTLLATWKLLPCSGLIALLYVHLRVQTSRGKTISNWKKQTVNVVRRGQWVRFGLPFKIVCKNKDLNKQKQLKLTPWKQNITNLGGGVFLDVEKPCTTPFVKLCTPLREPPSPWVWDPGMWFQDIASDNLNFLLKVMWKYYVSISFI